MDSNELISLGEEISREANIDTFTLLLKINIIQVYNERELLGQKEIHNLQFEEMSVSKGNIGGLC